MNAHTCAYRWFASELAAQAAYEEFRQSASSPTGTAVPDITPEWKDLPTSVQGGWRNIFRAGHRAYRDYIRWENRLIHDKSAAETLAHLENARRNSEVAPEPGSETPPDWEHKEY